jgi:SNF2 family DNA or RNA helicase
MLTAAMTHQRAAVDKLNRLRVGALFMEMGTGKTRCFVELAENKISNGKASRAVILCPVSAKNHIADEITKHCGHLAIVHGGAYCQLPTRYNVIGIESLSSSISAMNKLRECAESAVVVIDESHLVKNRDTARTRHISDSIGNSRYRYLSTGTPMPNGVEDLWSQMQLLSPLVLGYKSYSEFSRKHLKHTGDALGMYGQGRICGRFNTDVIAAKIAPYSFEARKSDCLDLPPKTYSYRTSSLDDDAASVYADAKHRILFGKKAFEVDDATIFRLFTALQLISSGIVPAWLYKDNEPRPTIRNPKAAALAESLSAANGKTVVWCKYRAEADMAEAVAIESGKRVCRIDGNVSTSDRHDRIAEFKTSEDVLVSTIQVGGMSHDFGFADYSIFFGNSFDYMLRAQAEDRTHRAMMTGKAHYIDLYTDTGIDRKIARSLKRKENAVKAFQDTVRKLRAAKDERAIGAELAAL